MLKDARREQNKEAQDQMNIMNQTKWPVVSIGISIILFNLINRAILSPGRFINHFFPCEQNPRNSFPCYGIYDVIAMFICAGIFILSVILLIVIIIKSTKNRK